MYKIDCKLNLNRSTLYFLGHRAWQGWTAASYIIKGQLPPLAFDKGGGGGECPFNIGKIFPL